MKIGSDGRAAMNGNFETNLWVVVTPGHTYGPFRTERQAAGTPVAKWTTATVRLMTEADSAAIDAQDEELDPAGLTARATGAPGR